MHHRNERNADNRRLEENRFEAVSLFRRNPRCLAEDKGGLGSSAEVFAWQLRLQEKLAQTSAAAKPGGVQQAVDFWLQRSKAVLGRQQYFLAYEHGKAAVRLGSGARPDGLHSFGAPPATAAGSASPEEPASMGCWCPEEAAVLHYAHGSFQAVAEKLRRLCASKGSWWRCYALYTQGRHLSDQDLSSIYRGAVALCDDEAEAARQIASGVCAAAEPATVFFERARMGKSGRAVTIYIPEEYSKAIQQWADKIEGMKEDIYAIMQDESLEKELSSCKFRLADLLAGKRGAYQLRAFVNDKHCIGHALSTSENLEKHRKTINSRPAKEWFISNADKQKLKEAENESIKNTEAKMGEEAPEKGKKRKGPLTEEEMDERRKIRTREKFKQKKEEEKAERAKEEAQSRRSAKRFKRAEMPVKGGPVTKTLGQKIHAKKKVMLHLSLPGVRLSPGSNRMAPNGAIVPVPEVSESRLCLQKGGVDESGWYSKNGALVQRSQAQSSQQEKDELGRVSATQQSFMDHVKAGRLDRVEDLLEFRRDEIDLNFQEEWQGKTALMLATLANQVEIVDVLLEARADPHIRDRTEMRYTPLEVAQVIMEDEDPEFQEVVNMLKDASGHDHLSRARRSPYDMG
ncbi:unnamed protein product [Polarella glacialis]|uniref:Uncharacterized protein n=1 Tax=Polarella glacialis TaxID=89957 RepID=A0A813HR55_POLGL|nr:unnamed protein product [Polarella glacialis]